MHTITYYASHRLGAAATAAGLAAAAAGAPDVRVIILKAWVQKGRARKTVVSHFVMSDSAGLLSGNQTGEFGNFSPHVRDQNRRFGAFIVCFVEGETIKTSKRVPKRQPTRPTNLNKFLRNDKQSSKKLETEHACDAYTSSLHPHIQEIECQGLWRGRHRPSNGSSTSSNQPDLTFICFYSPHYKCLGLYSRIFGLAGEGTRDFGGFQGNNLLA